MSTRAPDMGSLIVRLALLLLAAIGFAPAAMAQSAVTVSNTTTGTINNTTTCTSPLVRNFSVTSTFTVADVNIGILATHSYRGDMQITLQSPNGTRVQIVNGEINSIDGNNFNVLLDDAATQVVNTDAASGNHSTTAPPYQNTFRPNNALSAFNGGPMNGTWRLEICDLFPSSDNGAFQRADLTLQPMPANIADLSLTKTLIGATPTSGGNVTWRLAVTNSGTSSQSASGVAVTDTLPDGFVFTSASGTGTFNAATGVWTVGAIGIGQTRTIDITGSINASAGATITNSAEVTSSSVLDPDSTPGNGITTEDDYATHSFVVAGARVAGVPPVLSCPAGTVVFDWDPLTWTPGSTSNSYPLSTLGSVAYSLTNPGVWVNNATYGGQSPALQSVANGGFTGQRGLMLLANQANRSAVVTATVTLPNVMQGAQFRVFDVDFAAGQFADRLVIEGRLAGATVLPTLTNGVSNYTISNTAYGDGASADASADGNIVVTFSGPIDTIIFRYGNHSAAPVDPGQQGIILGDVTYCHPTTTLDVQKTSTVLSSPIAGATNPKAIPGSVMEYCVTVTNSGTVPATAVTATDTLPAGVTYVAGSLTTGNTCATATTAEDDNNTGADETNPFGASFNAGTATGTAPSLAAGATFAFKMRATVN